jgi:hypothetical protein
MMFSGTGRSSFGTRLKAGHSKSFKKFSTSSLNGSNFNYAKKVQGTIMLMQRLL